MSRALRLTIALLLLVFVAGVSQGEEATGSGAPEPEVAAEVAEGRDEVCAKVGRDEIVATLLQQEDPELAFITLAWTDDSRRGEGAPIFAKANRCGTCTPGGGTLGCMCSCDLAACDCVAGCGFNFQCRFDCIQQSEQCNQCCVYPDGC
ncbi:MAG: hypothetical protein GY719_27505 [bacterium]|nr:hypothetical protein [bacterium]